MIIRAHLPVIASPAVSVAPWFTAHMNRSHDQRRRDGGAQRVTSQDQADSLISVQRPSLNKVLKDFERAGLITVHYAGIYIVDAEGLSAKDFG
jgi:CRP-like cAMP-binding protein